MACKDIEKRRQYQKQYVEKHREGMKEYNRQYYTEHREEILHRKKKYHAKHKEEQEKRHRKRFVRVRTETPWLLHMKSAKERCDNPNNNRYKWYGGKGIRMLLTQLEIEILWKRDHADQMEKPSIDRINPSGDYIFGNCRFLELSENVIRGRKARMKKLEETHRKEAEEIERANKEMKEEYRRIMYEGCKRREKEKNDEKESD